MFSHRILMCRPDFFEVKYKINPWMDKSAPVDLSKAHSQWLNLHHTILRLGGYVEYIDPVRGLPDMVFTANGGLCHNGTAIVSRFVHLERRGEEEYFAEFFRNHGLTTHSITSKFEGAGDAFVVDETLFLGHGFRTEPAAAMEIMNLLGIRKLVLCDLIDPKLYHLDTCFCPLGDHDFLYYPGAFSGDTVDAFESLRTHGFEPLAVEQDEANSFACNAVFLPDEDGSRGHVIMPEGSGRVGQALEARGFRVHPVPIGEFLKSGGACKCLTLNLGVY